MADIIHRVGIRATPSQVYEALATADGVSGWWTRTATGDDRVGGTLTFRFLRPDGEEIGAFDMEVLELSPDERVRWRVSAGPEEWVGTEVEFSLSRQDDWTVVLFGHRNWREPVEFMAHCSMKWATFLLSLRDLVETGRGKPSPDDVKVDNWN